MKKHTIKFYADRIIQYKILSNFGYKDICRSMVISREGDIVYKHHKMDECLDEEMDDLFGYLPKKYFLASDEIKRLHFRNNLGYDISEFSIMYVEYSGHYYFPDLYSLVRTSNNLFTLYNKNKDLDILNFSYSRNSEFYSCSFYLKDSLIEMVDFVVVMSEYCLDVVFEVDGIKICNGMRI
jgi:hypothetical protein